MMAAEKDVSVKLKRIGFSKGKVYTYSYLGSHSLEDPWRQNKSVRLP